MQKDSSSIASPEEIEKQKKLLENLAKPGFNPRPVAIFLCQHHGTRNLEQIVERTPFGSRPDAWSLMRERTIGVEVGSVKRTDGKPNQTFTFTLDKDRNAQEVKCFLSPQNVETCRFLDDPRIPSVQQWENPFNHQKIPGDLSKACIYNCIMRHRWSSFPIVIDVALGHLHSGLDVLEHLEEKDRTFEAAGALKGGFMSITQTKEDGEDAENAPIHTMRSGPANPAFVKTMALINETNIRNGIVKIPREVCLEAELPVFKGAPIPSDDDVIARMERMHLNTDNKEDRSKLIEKLTQDWETGRKDLEEVDHFYAIPVNHVMAWPLRSPEFCQANGIEVEMFSFNMKGESILLYFLVNNVQFEAMMRDWMEPEKSWINKVDMRPLDKVSVRFVPFTDRARYPDIPAETTTLTGVVALRAYLTFAVPPVGLTPEAIASLAPTLSPDFPSADQWLTEAQKKELAVERYIKIH